MALASLKTRIERLQAKHKAEDGRVLDIIGYCDSQGWPVWNGKGPFIGVIGGVRFKPGEFTERCFLQQKQLMADVAGYAAQLGEEGPQDAQAPGIVGTPAPLKPGQKVKNFIHLPDGTEIQLKRT